ncbi:hypothetical protein ACIOHE_39145 [Streptomyces sp. NPDC087851]|uniref:hypothetical protein n=1 Tax=Streptomyces sp. NPDC087851 TaxID=3365810 RepID=UPI0038204FD3
MIADEVQTEIDRLGAADATPGLTAVALRLASALDAIPVGEAPTSQAVLADKLAAIMTRIRALAPPAVKGDKLDDLASRRKKRRGA